MARIFIDLTEDETHWNGAIPVTINDHDGLTGSDMSIGIGDHELVVTTSQMITLYELLDVWMNTAPAKDIGGVRTRVHRAIEEMIKDRAGVFDQLFGPTYKAATFVHEFTEYVRLQGLRFRVTGDEPAFSPPPKRARP